MDGVIFGGGCDCGFHLWYLAVFCLVLIDYCTCIFTMNHIGLFDRQERWDGHVLKIDEIKQIRPNFNYCRNS